MCVFHSNLLLHLILCVCSSEIEGKSISMTNIKYSFVHSLLAAANLGHGGAGIHPSSHWGTEGILELDSS